MATIEEMHQRFKTAYQEFQASSRRLREESEALATMMASHATIFGKTPPAGDDGQAWDIAQAMAMSVSLETLAMYYRRVGSALGEHSQALRVASEAATVILSDGKAS